MFERPPGQIADTVGGVKRVLVTGMSGTGKSTVIRLRRGADLEVVTTVPVPEVVDAILRHVAAS